jgi:hypothetical protein
VEAPELGVLAALNPETVLQIIRLSLELAIRILDDMPAEQRVKFWERHERNMDFLEKLFNKLQKEAS